MPIRAARRAYLRAVTDNLGIVEVLMLLAVLAAVVVLFARIVRATVRQELGRTKQQEHGDDGVR